MAHTMLMHNILAGLSSVLFSSVISPSDSLEISVMELRPQEKPEAVVYMLHGICGKKEKMLPLMEYLAGKGIACFASDHRGHGDSIRSEEDRGYAYRGGADAVVADIGAVVEMIRHEYPDTPLVLLGHSMGSLAARVYARGCEDELSALILCGSPSKNPLAPLGRFLIGTFYMGSEGRLRPEILQTFASDKFNRRFKNEGYQAWTCSDPEVRRVFAEDPECNFRLTADWGMTLLDLMDRTYSSKGVQVANPDVPVLFLSGEDDPCMVDEKAFLKSVDAMRKLGYSDVKSITYPGMRHEVLLEKEKHLVWNDILNFINDLLKRNSTN